MLLRVKPGREYVLGGKVYKSGAEVDVPEKFARVLVGPKGPLEPGAPSRNPTDLPSPAAAPANDTAALRADYEALVGKRPFMGWDAEELKEKMEAYRRRDMTSSGYTTTALQAKD